MIESCQDVLLQGLVEVCQQHAVKLSNWVAVEVRTQNEMGTVGQLIDQISLASLKPESMKHQHHRHLKIELSSPYWLRQVKKTSLLDVTGIARRSPTSTTERSIN